MRPPRIATVLVRLAAPRTDRTCLLDELAEEFDRHARDTGSRRARRWYWRQALTAVGPLVRLRLARRWPSFRLPVRAAAEDARQALRWIRRHRRLSAVVTGTLSASFAAALAAFVVADAAVLHPLPPHAPGEIVRAWTTGPTLPGNGGNVASWPDFQDLRERAPAFAVLSAYSTAGMRFTGHGAPREIDVAAVAPGFDRLFGVPMALGRAFDEADYSARPRTVILAHRFWLREFGGDPAVVGRTLDLDERPYEVVGVRPSTRVSVPLDPHDVWIPLVPSRDVFWQVARGTGWLTMLGRLRPSVSLADAERELTSAAAALAAAYPDSNKARTVGRVAPLADDVAGPIAPAIALLGCALTAVMLIACGNVTNLLLSSTAGRQREFAVRSAIGASFARLVRQLWFEAAALCGVSAAIGAGCAAPLAAWFLAVYQGDTPLTIAVSPGVIAAAAVLAAVFAAGLTVAQAAALSRRVDSAVLRAGGRTAAGGSLARHALITAQVALSIVLVAAGVALVRTSARLAAIDTGFRPARVLTFRVMPSDRRFTSPEASLAAYDAMIRNLEAVPGVESAAAAVGMPLTSSGWAFGVRAPGARTETRVRVNLTTAAYFDTLGIRLVEGRLLTDAEQRSATDLVLVNEPAARLVAPNGSAVGMRLPYSGRVWQIVGVVAGTRGRALRDAPEATLYLPWHLAGRRPQAVAVRTTPDPASLMPAIARAVQSIDATAPVVDPETLDNRLADARRAETFRATLLTALATVAVLLAALGAYSVTAVTVVRRRREFGVRLALGERPRSILRRAIGTAVVPALIGSAIGIGGAAAAARRLGPFLYDTEAASPSVLATAAAVMIALAAAAAWTSARAAARTDPVTVLRD